MDLAEADLASSTLDERNAILVERLVNGTHARLAATEGNTSDGVPGESTFVTGTKPFDNGGPHTEFDPIQRDEPDDVPDPNDTDPSTRNRMNVGETPVSVSRNDRGDKLGEAESGEEGKGRAFHEEEAVGTSSENQSLGNDRNL